MAYSYKVGTWSELKAALAQIEQVVSNHHLRMGNFIVFNGHGGTPTKNVMELPEEENEYTCKFGQFFFCFIIFFCINSSCW